MGAPLTRDTFGTANPRRGVMQIQARVSGSTAL
jgi:hypothetical protein